MPNDPKVLQIKLIFKLIFFISRYLNCVLVLESHTWRILFCFLITFSLSRVLVSTSSDHEKYYVAERAIFKLHASIQLAIIISMKSSNFFLVYLREIVFWWGQSCNGLCVAWCLSFALLRGGGCYVWVHWPSLLPLFSRH